MQFFGETNIDFIGRRKGFLGLSAVLILAGAASLIMKGGPKLGIDFKGGTLVYVKFQQPPDVEKIRGALTARGLTVATLQPFDDGSELKIDLDLESDVAMTSGKVQIVETLNDVFEAQPGKLDFNNAGVERPPPAQFDGRPVAAQFRGGEAGRAGSHRLPRPEFRTRIRFLVFRFAWRRLA